MKMSERLANEVARLEHELAAANERIATLEQVGDSKDRELRRLSGRKTVGGPAVVKAFLKRHPTALDPNQHGAPGLRRLLQKMLEHECAGAFAEFQPHEVVQLPRCVHKAAAVALMELLEGIMPDVETPEPTMAVAAPSQGLDPFGKQA